MDSMQQVEPGLPPTPPLPDFPRGKSALLEEGNELPHQEAVQQFPPPGDSSPTTEFQYRVRWSTADLEQVCAHLLGDVLLLLDTAIQQDRANKAAKDMARRAFNARVGRVMDLAAGPGCCQSPYKLEPLFGGNGISAY